MLTNVLIVCLLFAIIALLYSSIGHAGASGYLAIMALLSFAPETIKPTSLVLNILVALIASIQFIRSGYFEKSLFSSFIFSSVPASFIGGYMNLSPHLFRLVAGSFLVLSACLLLFRQFVKLPAREYSKPTLPLTLSIGSVIGFISGIIGVGGGIFLSPVLIMLNWTTVKKAAGISALFILCNSVSGLIGHLSSLHHLDYKCTYWGLAVLVGGAVGSYLGTKKFNNRFIIYILFLVLISAGLKFIFVGS